MNRRLHHSFNDLVNKNKLEIIKDPQEIDRIERKIDDKHTVEKQKVSRFRRQA